MSIDARCRFMSFLLVMRDLMSHRRCLACCSGVRAGLGFVRLADSSKVDRSAGMKVSC